VLEKEQVTFEDVIKFNVSSAKVEPPYTDVPYDAVP
jgi:hypothetical protein